MEFEICYVPHEPHGWIPPAPTAASYRALLPIGITGVRLQYNFDDPRWWGAALREAVQGGMRITGNFVANLTEPSHDIEENAFEWMEFYGPQMARVSFGNEPGYTVGHDGMRDYVMNYFVPFARGVRRANPAAVIGGCDAESQDTQQIFIEEANELLLSDAGVDICDLEFVHSYGRPMGGGDYATREEFERVYRLGAKPLRDQYYSEIDIQNLPEAMQRMQDATAAALASGATPRQANDAGGAARGLATDSELQILLDWTRSTHTDFPNVKGIAYGDPAYFFTRVPNGTGSDTWSSWTYGKDGPVVSDFGRKFQALFAEINGPAPQQGTGRQPGRRS